MASLQRVSFELVFSVSISDDTCADDISAATMCSVYNISIKGGMSAESLRY